MKSLIDWSNQPRKHGLAIRRSYSPLYFILLEYLYSVGTPGQIQVQERIEHFLEPAFAQKLQNFIIFHNSYDYSFFLVIHSFS